MNKEKCEIIAMMKIEFGGVCDEALRKRGLESYMKLTRNKS
jgi:hypothetical protein